MVTLERELATFAEAQAWTAAEQLAVERLRAAATIQTLPTATILHSVGKGGGNSPADVRAIQNRLIAFNALQPGVETPAPTAIGPIPDTALHKTIAAIKQLQVHVRWWMNYPNGLQTAYQQHFHNMHLPSPVPTSHAFTAERIEPGDATLEHLNRVTFSLVTPQRGDTVIRLFDYVKSIYTLFPHGFDYNEGPRVTGAPIAWFTTHGGLTPNEAAALIFVCDEFEGRFQTINTYDRALLTFGFPQFTVSGTLQHFLARVKREHPATFDQLYRNWGMDVETPHGADPVLTLLEPGTARVLRNDDAARTIGTSPLLSAVIIKSGGDADVQRVQVQTAIEQYALVSLRHRVTYTAPDGTVSHATFRDILTSIKAIGTLFDRTVQEGGAGGPARVQRAVLAIANAHHLPNITSITTPAFQQEIVDTVEQSLRTEHRDSEADRVHRIIRYLNPPPPPAAPHPPAAPPAPAPKAHALNFGAGQLVLNHTPALASHNAPADRADLILCWNEIPSNTTKVDVVVHLHGYSGELSRLELAHKLYLSGLDFGGDPDAAASAGSTPGRTRPTLGVLPRGKHDPSQRRNDRFTFPALTSLAGMRTLIDYSLARFGQQSGINNPKRARLIVTAHSGGGAALLALLAQVNAHPDTDVEPDEVHIFDALYEDAAPLIAWANRRIRRADGALRVLYLPGDAQNPGTMPQSQSVARALAPLITANPSRAEWYRSEVVRGYPIPRGQDRHNYMPRFYGWRLMAAANASVPNAQAAPTGTSVRAHALDSTSTTPYAVHGDTVTCGTCMAREHRVRAGTPASLTEVDSVLLMHGHRGMQLDTAALQALKQMIAAARADGIAAPLLLLVSGHRDYDQQARLWRNKLLDVLSQKGCTVGEVTCARQAIDGTSTALRGQPMPQPREAWQIRFATELTSAGCHLSCDVSSAIHVARQDVAPPGASAHHTGRAVDLYVGTAPNQRSSTTTAPDAVAWQRSQTVYKWLVCNAARFQFYPYNAEPWHWEYNPSVPTTQGFADDEAAPQRLDDVQPATQAYNDGWATVAFNTPTDNADLRRDAQAQWDAHPRVHSHFDNSFDRYLELAPLYIAQGIRNPAEYVATRIVNVTFFGRTTIGHRDLSAPLKRAEDALKARGITPALRSFWSFNARPIRGTSSALSKHAVGRAIDINPDENPRIIHRDDVLVIQAVTGVNMAERQQVEVMRQASHKFQHDFTQPWVDQQTSQPLARAIRNRRSELNHYAQHGLLTLEQSLIDEFKAAGFHWGGDWATSKDFMHFELSGW